MATDPHACGPARIHFRTSVVIVPCNRGSSCVGYPTNSQTWMCTAMRRHGHAYMQTDKRTGRHASIQMRRHGRHHRHADNNQNGSASGAVPWTCRSRRDQPPTKAYRNTRCRMCPVVNDSHKSMYRYMCQYMTSRCSKVSAKRCP